MSHHLWQHLWHQYQVRNTSSTSCFKCWFDAPPQCQVNFVSVKYNGSVSRALYSQLRASWFKSVTMSKFVHYCSSSLRCMNEHLLVVDISEWVVLTPKLQRDWTLPTELEMVFDCIGLRESGVWSCLNSPETEYCAVYDLTFTFSGLILY